MIEECATLGRDLMMIKILPKGNPRKRHPRLRWIGRKALHLIITFVLGVALATIYHELVTNNSVRNGAEKICILFSRDADECKDNIDNVLDMSDDEVQNNININGGGK